MRRTLLALAIVFLPVLILAQEPSAPPETKQTPPRKSSAQTAATPAQTPSERPQREEREAMARRSPHGKHIIAAKSGHWIQLDRPDAVIRAIREMVSRCGS